MLVEIFQSADRRELANLNPSVFRNNSPYRSREVMRKRDVKNCKKKYLIEMLSLAQRPSKNGCALTAKQVAGLADCKVSEVYKIRN